MLLRKRGSHADFIAGIPFKGPLDLRVPEDRYGEEQAREKDRPIWSPAIGKAVSDFVRAAESGRREDLRRAAREVVDATSAYYRVSGVPLHAHDPIPAQLIERLLPIKQLVPGEQTRQAVGRFVDLFDDSVKRLLHSQVMRHLDGRAARGGQVGSRSMDDLAEFDALDETPELHQWNEALIRDLSRGGRTAERVIGTTELSPLLNEQEKRDGMRASARQSDPLRVGEVLALRRELADSAAFASASSRETEAPPAGSYPRNRAPKEIAGENPRYPWHPKWRRYDLDKDGDGSEYGSWYTDEGDFEWSNDGGKTWHYQPQSRHGWAAQGPPNRNDNPRGLLFRKPLIS